MYVVLFCISTFLFGLVILLINLSSFRSVLKVSGFLSVLLQWHFSQIKTSLDFHLAPWRVSVWADVSVCVCDGFASWAQSTPVLPAWEMRGSILQVVWLYFHNLTHAVHLSLYNWMQRLYGIKKKTSYPPNGINHLSVMCENGRPTDVHYGRAQRWFWSVLFFILAWIFEWLLKYKLSSMQKAEALIPIPQRRNYTIFLLNSVHWGVLQRHPYLVWYDQYIMMANVS